ncbi:hypothetical protein ADEAN_000699400 [Angomonas deanei]|uniref:DUF676 domain-containing protein n=1 Tax=Angomonas deanei TaxID=59799 RepID=A0A7G2CK84_9TRYP|nr:hypothetical protein ADEAN_000699400 [Angomonas deanei]
MDFKNLEGFEEIFTDGVLDPSLTSPRFQEGIKTYKKLTDRVYLLYDPPTADFDIVFIHGIGSDEFGCWTTPQGVLWPATFLPQDFPRARIMTVGYAHSLWNFKNEDSAKEEKPAAEKHATAELEEGKKDAPKGKSSFFDYIPDSLESKFGSFLGSEKKGKTPASTEVTAAPAVNDVPERVESPSNSMLHDLLINEKSVEGVAKDFDSRGHKRSSRSLQSFRRVGADIAVRLCSNEVNIGCRPVVFVTHSMGGLITKQMLVSLFRIVETSPSKVISDGDGSGTTLTTETIDALRSAARLLYSTSGVVFYGTPHFGSSLASVITGLQRYYQSLGGLTPTNVVTGLGDHNKEELTLLNDQFLEVVERAREYAPDGVEDATQRNAPLSVLSFGETQKLHGLVLIVEPESSNPCPHDSRFPFHLIDADHSGVNRPESKIFPSYSIFYGFLDRLQQRGCLGGSNARKWDNTSLRQIGVPDGAENTDETDLIGDAKWKEIFDSHYASFIGGKPARTAGIDRSDLYQAQHSTSSLFLLQQESEKSLQSLRYMLRSFFGHVIPSELDGLQSLGVDAREFIDNCTSMLASIKGSYMHVKDGTELAALNQKFDILNDRILTSFVLPFKLISYWIHHTIDVLTTLKRQQNERALSTLYAQSAGGGWVSTHLTSQEMKEFERIEGEVGVLTEEWEGFRRYINVLLRPFKYTSGASLSEVLQGMEESFWWRSLPGAADLRKENVDTLFFSHSIRCVMKTELREGDCLSALVNVYLKDALSREVQLDDMMGSGASSPAPPSRWDQQWRSTVGFSAVGGAGIVLF